MLESIETPTALPQNLDAEQAMLGSILIDNLTLSVVSPILKEADFFLESHRRIYRALLDFPRGLRRSISSPFAKSWTSPARWNGRGARPIWHP